MMSKGYSSYSSKSGGGWNVSKSRRSKRSMSKRSSRGGKGGGKWNVYSNKNKNMQSKPSRYGGGAWWGGWSSFKKKKKNRGKKNKKNKNTVSTIPTEDPQKITRPETIVTSSTVRPDQSPGRIHYQKPWTIYRAGD